MWRYVPSFRLRTLPLSMAGIIVGSMAAYGNASFSWVTMVLALSTVIALQIVSNLANELGDAITEADSDDRQGPKFGIQAGTVSRKEVMGLILVFSFLAMLSGACLVGYALGGLINWVSVSFLALGGLCIVAAVKYTLGKRPYGYRMGGDAAVFVFFGLLSVLGSYYLQVHTLTLGVLLPAVSMGTLSVGVLNVNNMRDMESDRRVNKLTLASWMGIKWARVYHVSLIVVALVTWVAFDGWWILVLSPLYAWHLYMCLTREGKALDVQLPLLVLSTFGVAVVYFLMSL